MRLESLEPKRLLAGSASTAAAATQAAPIDQFNYSSDLVDVGTIAAMREGDLQFTEFNEWFKPRPNGTPRFSNEGYVIAERFESDRNPHEMFVTRALGSSCFGVEGIYMLPRKHHMISFDVRIPTTEASWLSNHRWAMMMQLWGPREAGETPRQPPLAIFTRSVDGEPTWNIAVRGDSRRITQTGEFEEKLSAQVPFTGLGEWNRWSVEFVPDPFGKGLVRAWLNGNLVGEWRNVQVGYYSFLGGAETGPLNPSIGLYAPLAENGMEVHFDNISVQCTGDFQRSIAGVVTGGDTAGNQVVATNLATRKAFSTATGSDGVYALNVPAGNYSIEAFDSQKQHRVSFPAVSVRNRDQLVNLQLREVSSPSGPNPVVEPVDPNPNPINPNPDPVQPDPVQPDPVETDPQPVKPAAFEGRIIVGDVDGDGSSDVIRQHQGGSVWVTFADRNGRFTTRLWGAAILETVWQDVLTGDFNGDGLSDLLSRNAQGEWWVSLSTGSSFSNQKWESWSTGVSWADILVGDFDGDGLDDVAARVQGTDSDIDGSWWVAAARDGRFITRRWDAWDANSRFVDVVVGDFNGDGRDDIAGRNVADGAWWVSKSTGSRFIGSQWARWSHIAEWSDVVVGDLDGDGRSDILGRSLTNNTWWAAKSTGDRFDTALWGRWSSDEDWLDISAQDVNNDGRMDLVARAASDNSWWVMLSAARFSHRNRRPHEQWGPVWDAEINWLQVEVADFDGDDRMDILGVRSPSSFSLTKVASR